METSDKGLTTVRSKTKSILLPVLLYGQLRNKELKNILPSVKQNRATLFKILITVHVYPFNNAKKICYKSGCASEATRAGITYLLSQGLIKQSKHARQLHVFDGAWIFDKVYSTTASGNKIIREGLRIAGIEY